MISLPRTANRSHRSVWSTWKILGRIIQHLQFTNSGELQWSGHLLPSKCPRGHATFGSTLIMCAQSISMQAHVNYRRHWPVTCIMSWACHLSTVGGGSWAPSCEAKLQACCWTRKNDANSTASCDPGSALPLEPWSMDNIVQYCNLVRASEMGRQLAWIFGVQVDRPDQCH